MFKIYSYLVGLGLSTVFFSTQVLAQTPDVPKGSSGSGLVLPSGTPKAAIENDRAKFEFTGDSNWAWFVSKTLLPSSGLRVVIRNITPNANPNVIPYTDRKYDGGNRSESFLLGKGSSHNSRYFIVQPGLNTFSYQIRRGNEILESGSFTETIYLMAFDGRDPRLTNDQTSYSEAWQNPQVRHHNEKAQPEPQYQVPSLDPALIRSSPQPSPEVIRQQVESSPYFNALPPVQQQQIQNLLGF